MSARPATWRHARSCPRTNAGLSGLSRYAGPATLILSSLAERAQAGLRPHQGHRAFRRRSTGPGDPARGAEPAGGTGPDRVGRERRPPSPLRSLRSGWRLRSYLATQRHPPMWGSAASQARGDRCEEDRIGTPRPGVPSAPLMPEGAALPVRRGVRRAPGRRHGTETAVRLARAERDPRRARVEPDVPCLPCGPPFKHGQCEGRVLGTGADRAIGNGMRGSVSATCSGHRKEQSSRFCRSSGYPSDIERTYLNDGRDNTYEKKKVFP